MNILIVTPHFYPENFRINDFADALIERNIEVSVLTAIPDYPEGKYYDGFDLFRKRKEIYKKIRIYRNQIIPRGDGSKFRLFLNYISYVVSGILTTIFVKEKFDIIFVFEPSPITVGIPAIVLKRIQQIPIVFWVLDLWPESVKAAGNLRTNYIPNLLLPIIKFIYNESDKILVSSRGFIDSIVEKGIDRNKIEYFPQWAESLFRPINRNNYKYSNLIPPGFNVMFAGNIGEAQDFYSIIETAVILKEYKEINIIILGDGRKASWLKKQIAENQLSDTIYLLGSFPLSAMPEFYSMADVMLISLKNDFIFSLTVPAKIQSYLACAKPLVAMIDGEAARIVEESGAGYSGSSGDYYQLAQNIIQLSKDRDNGLLPAMGFNAYDYFKNNFDRTMLVDRALSIFNDVLKR